MTTLADEFAELDILRRRMVSVAYRMFLVHAARHTMMLRLWSFERSYSGGPQ